ncbi:MAG: hypothetical protein R2709_14375 [Marmoricola sp.]
MCVNFIACSHEEIEQGAQTGAGRSQARRLIPATACLRATPVTLMAPLPGVRLQPRG